ncbi:hypothetical protein RHOER0001_0145 [Rhodococcus erythropolis SK121]|nr:hypothetical protein RHOER0001_0145 [Rhodococcus erythropolis SK121]
MNDRTALPPRDHAVAGRDCAAGQVETTVTQIDSVSLNRP